MKALICGCAVPEEYDGKIEYLSSAGNRFQWNLINTIRKQNHETTFLSYIAIPVPEEIKNVLKTNTGAECYYFKQNGFLKNLLYYRKKVKETINEVDIIICYNNIYAWWGIASWARRRGKKSVLILADYSGVESYKNLKNKIFSMIQLYDMRRYDRVVGLSKNIQSKLLSRQQFICLEGGIDLSDYKNFTLQNYNKNDIIRVMYSGLLSDVTGVSLLLKMIPNISDENIEFYISGKGNMKNQVEELASEDSRVKFIGHVEYHEYLKLLNKAHILINPRNMNLPENQNNFPSKMMEYLATGKVIVSTKFPGFQKFEQTAYFCESDVPNLERTLQLAIHEYPRTYMSVFENNRKFAEQFDWMLQVEKILTN